VLHDYRRLISGSTCRPADKSAWIGLSEIVAEYRSWGRNCIFRETVFRVGSGKTGPLRICTGLDKFRAFQLGPAPVKIRCALKTYIDRQSNAANAPLPP